MWLQILNTRKRESELENKKKEYSKAELKKTLRICCMIASTLFIIALAIACGYKKMDSDTSRKLNASAEMKNNPDDTILSKGIIDTEVEEASLSEDNSSQESHLSEADLTQSDIEKIRNSLLQEVDSQSQITYTPDKKELEEMIRDISDSLELNEVTKEQIVTEVTNELITYMNNNPSFKGEQGEQGVQGSAGSDGQDGEDGLDGQSGATPVKGVDYFTEADIDSISNRIETSIIDSGELTVTGLDGKSAYELAVDNGFTGSLESWLESLKAVDGESAYEQAVAGGYQGTKEDFYKLLSTTGTTIENLEQQLGSLSLELNKVSVNFQSGCNEIASGITACGEVTASNTSPSNMVKNIKAVYEKRYKSGYSQGYIDGQKSVNTTANIVYTRHYHSGSASTGTGCYSNKTYHYHSSTCYGICPGYWIKDTNSWGDKDGNGDRRYRYYCSYCGKTAAEYGSSDTKFHGVHQSLKATCGYSNGQVTGYSLGCGYTDGQILSAIITY